MRIKKERLLLIIVILFVTVLYTIAFIIGHISPYLFLLTVLIIYFAAPPKLLLSPKNVLTGYYLLWFGVAPVFANLYHNLSYTDITVIVSYLMLFCNYALGYLTLDCVDFNLPIKTNDINLNKVNLFYVKKSKRLSLVFLVLSYLMIMMIILYSQKPYLWFSNPGRAFLIRHGTGQFYIILLMFSGISSVLAGYYCYHVQKIMPTIGFTFLLLLLVPFLGGKAKVFMIFAFFLLPWFFFSKVFTKKTILFVILFIGSFLFVTISRNISWIHVKDLLWYSMNYFDTFKMLILSVKSVPQKFFMTFLMPFNKIFMFFGSNQHSFFSVSCWLTSIYFPNDWAIHATRQFPIESDMYISFYYILGIPFFILEMMVIGLLFRKAVLTRSLGFCYVAAYMVFYMVSHLRGGLILWTDFYTIPMLILSYWILRNFYL